VKFKFGGFPLSRFLAGDRMKEMQGRFLAGSAATPPANRLIME